MQTFLPYSDFDLCARSLDYRRLGKQRVECLQILNAITYGTGWKHHPAVKMWVGYEGTLISYAKSICEEWIFRGYKDTVLEKLKQYPYDQDIITPWWLVRPELHRSHRSNLIRKDPLWYRKLGWTEPDNLPYWWPV